MSEQTAGDRTGQRVAIVINPSKFPDADVIRERAEAVVWELGFPDPIWLETTPDEVGTEQGRQAAADGASVVIAMGGDGTVRAVAQGIRGNDIAFGIVPAGTGNLLARNLGIPIDQFEDAVRVALTGADRMIDVGTVTIDRRAEETFLVMTGLGFDAESMANANEQLKARIGWAAYLVSGARAMVRKGFSVRIEADDVRRTQQRAQSVIVGNCGELQNSVKLMPKALPDDGILDTIVLSPQSVVGWVSLVTHILTRHRRGHKQLMSFESKTVEVWTKHPVEAEVDGDPIGKVRSMVCRVDPGVLRVRVPETEAAAS